MLAVLMIASMVIGFVGNRYLAKKAEERQEAQLEKAHEREQKQIKRASIKAVNEALASAAAHSTAVSIDKTASNDRLRWQHETNGDGYYRIATEAAREARETRVARHHGTVEPGSRRNS